MSPKETISACSGDVTYQSGASTLKIGPSVPAAPMVVDGDVKVVFHRDDPEIVVRQSEPPTSIPIPPYVRLFRPSKI